jgi:hypothetical protein
MISFLAETICGETKMFLRLVERRIHLFAAILAVAGSISCGQSTSVSLPSPNLPLPSVKTVDGIGILQLPDGTEFQTTLYGLKVIDQLRTAHKLPYYLLSGVSCNGCDESKSIYIHSPSDGPIAGGRQPRFDHPGRLIRREDRTVISETRMFFGNCVPGHPDAVIWFYQGIGNDKQRQSVFLAEVKDDRLTYGEATTVVLRPRDAEDSTRKSQCHELAGIDQWEEL